MSEWLLGLWPLAAETRSYILVCVISTAVSVFALYFRMRRRSVDYESTIKKLQDEIAGLQRKVGIDNLTKVPNRLEFIRVFQKNIEILHSKSRPFCVGYMDIVGFGRINSEVGHDNADKALIGFLQHREKLPARR